MATRTKEEDEKLVDGLFGLMLIVPHLLWEGFVLKVLWNWHLVQYGLPMLTTVSAIGISVVWGWLTFRMPKKSDVEHDSIYRFLVLLLGGAFMLLIGWCVKPA